MKKLPIKKGWLIAIVIIVVLAILNPSMASFKEHTGDKDVTRKADFLVCSLYNDGGDTYLGFLLNFLEVNESHVAYNPPPVQQSQGIDANMLINIEKAVSDEYSSEHDNAKKDKSKEKAEFIKAFEESQKNKK